jgi:methanogenic corrinoid protein MtbC1
MAHAEEESSQGRITLDVYETYFAALRAGDRQQCTKTVQTLVDSGVELPELYENLFQASMYHIGDLWERNEVSVAVEHRASAITESMLHLVYPILFDHEVYERKVIVSCVANEHHQIGGKMVADIMELNGWDAHFLGANTPLKDLLLAIEETEPDFVGLSVSIYFNLPKLLAVIDEIRRHHPDLRILVGGQAFRYGGVELVRDVPNVTYLESLDQLKEFLHATGAGR